MPGLKRLKNLVGQKFGRWTIVSFGFRKRKRTGSNVYWQCRCECGVEKAVEISHLKSGHSTSCGHDQNRIFDGLAARRRVLRAYAANAKKRGFIWAINDTIFISLATAPCHYCGAGPSNVSKSRSVTSSFTYNGIDRIDSNVGYVEGNVVTACAFCNKAKLNHSYEDFMSWVQRVAEHQKSLKCLPNLSVSESPQNGNRRPN